MRILCLHGKGTSGFIFKSQTSSFRSHLSDKNIEFDFIDAPFPSTPAPGIDIFYEPPYYSFWEENSVATIKASAEWLTDLLSRSGPYDAVMCFSQGCYLVASALLLHKVHNPTAPPPFKAAIFICGGAPLLIAEDTGFHISQETWDRDRAGNAALSAQADSEAILAQGSNRWVGGGSEVVDEEAVRADMSGPYTISIPTVHVYGSKDPKYVAGVQLSGLCEAKKRRVFNHKGGHEIPRNETVSKTIAELVNWALSEGKKVG